MARGSEGRTELAILKLNLEGQKVLAKRGGHFKQRDLERYKGVAAEDGLGGGVRNGNKGLS